MAINPPGGVSWLWALIYIAIGMYLIPMILGFFTSRGKAKETEG